MWRQRSLFGIRASELQAELALRQHRQTRELDIARAELQVLRDRVADLRRHEALLQGEVTNAQTRGNRLLAGLAGPAADLEQRRRSLQEFHQLDLRRHLDRLQLVQQELDLCQAARDRLRNAVRQLLAPFLGAAAPGTIPGKDAEHV